MHALRTAELDEDFAQHLVGLDRAGLDHSPATIYGLRPDWTIGYVNASWWRFASENGGGEKFAWGLGTPLLSVIPEPLHEFYRTRLTVVARDADVWEHDYLCSTPTEERWFRLRAVPLPGGAVLANHVQRSEARRDDPEPFDAERFTREGVVTMCCHCRCTKDPSDARWYWVPELIAQPAPRTSHALCPTCFVYYYS
jgi:hypothetical protein